MGRYDVIDLVSHNEASRPFDHAHVVVALKHSHAQYLPSMRTCST